MPELPEAETIAAGLRAAIEQKKIKSVTVRTPKLRRPLNIKKLNSLKNKMIKTVSRRGKAIVVEFSSRTALLIQLGMTGACVVCKGSDPVKKHEHVIFELPKNIHWRFEDPRRFGMLEVFNLDRENTFPKFIKTLGPEPLSDDFNGQYLFRITRDRSRSIRDVLLDQHVVCGIGNIYANEALFRSNIRPQKRAKLLTKKKCCDIVSHIKDVLEEAITVGGTTISDYKNVDGNTGKFVTRLLVYGKDNEACVKCGGKIKRIVISGRAGFYCPDCQK
jgi:formamidopyrimidine-DNA glycosylase